MLCRKRVHELVALSIVLVLSLSTFAGTLQQPGQLIPPPSQTPSPQPQNTPAQPTPTPAEPQANPSQETAPAQTAPAQPASALWHEPGDISSLDLYLGPGGEAMKPDLSSVTFIEEETGGYSTKYRVRDGAGNKWIVKIGNEAQPETVATRLISAVGYYTDITYLVPSVEIKGKGTFQNVRFEARPESVKRLGEWKWESNPFLDTRELQGLKVMMALVNNWDLKNANNRILSVHNEEAGRDELHYIVSDLGATFGKTGGAFNRNRNRPQDYTRTKFIVGVRNNILQFDYHGKNSEILRNITVEQARWIGDLLSQLSDQQISDAIRAANYGPEEAQLLLATIKARIEELKNLQG
ncbi:MAG TPA: hypothetical protein VK619_15115 [Pyrinomonadaceae bacterium]|nr:hypothetical protein [Pyrinomonadaceae bacterium]